MISVTLGDFTFMNLEVPSKIPLGGTQALAIQQLIGGGRVVDALGPVEAPIEWQGVFFGANAFSRAQYLEKLRVAGKSLVLKWHTLSITVMIQRFVYEFEFVNKIPYHITCEVVKNNSTLPSTLTDQTDWDGVIVDLVNTATASFDNLVDVPIPNATVTYGTSTFLSTLKSKIAALQKTMSSINSFVRATVSQINAVKAQIADIQNDISLQIASMENFLKTVTTLGGLYNNNPIAKNASNLSSCVNNYNNAIQLYNIQYHFMNVQKNLQQIGASPDASVTTTSTNASLFSLPTTITVQNANLYSLASKYYGNAMKWTLIANANNLQTPYVSSVMTLTIPKDGSSTGGINA